MTTEWKSTIVTLAHPIPVSEGSVINAVTLREPDVEALEIIEDCGFVEGERPTVKQLRVAIVALSNLTEEQARKLHRDDFGKVCQAAIPFVSGSPEPSEKDSSTEPNSTASPQTLPTG